MVESSGSDGRPGPEELDALIGEVRREAARRRAAPDFPVDEEAAVAVEMDRQGPVGGADLSGLVAELERLARIGSADPGPVPVSDVPVSDVPVSDVPVSDVPVSDVAVSEVAGLVASVTRTLARRLGRLESRAVGPAAGEGPGHQRDAGHSGSAAPSGPGTSGEAPPPATDAWGAIVTGHLDTSRDSLPGPTRILVAGAGAAGWVAHLESSGVLDVYGVDPAAPEYGDVGAVRAGPLAAHLAHVAPGGLRAAVLVGPVVLSDLAVIEETVDRLALVAGTVLVQAEAPWSWQRRLGVVAAETAPARPVSPETWMALLDGAGFAVSARYGAQGRDYLVVAIRPPADGDAASVERPGGSGRS